MRHAIQVLVLILLAFGAAGPFLVAQDAYFNWTVGLIVFGVVMALILGAHWCLFLQKNNIENMATESSFENVMRTELFWLQGVRPKLKLNNAKLWMTEGPATIVGKSYTSSYIFAIFLLAIGVLYMLGGGLKSEGVFGSLLESAMGRGIASSFLLYLLISSAAIFFMGAFSRFFAGKRK